MKSHRLLALGGVLLLAACTDEPQASRVLAAAGYTDIQMTGFRWFACDSKSDNWRTGFRAKALNGTLVTGAVCSGFLKGATIRLD